MTEIKFASSVLQLLMFVSVSFRIKSFPWWCRSAISYGTFWHLSTIRREFHDAQLLTCSTWWRHCPTTWLHRCRNTEDMPIGRTGMDGHRWLVLWAQL